MGWVPKGHLTQQAFINYCIKHSENKSSEERVPFTMEEVKKLLEMSGVDWHKDEHFKWLSIRPDIVAVMLKKAGIDLSQGVVGEIIKENHNDKSSNKDNRKNEDFCPKKNRAYLQRKALQR